MAFLPDSGQVLIANVMYSVHVAPVCLYCFGVALQAWRTTGSLDTATLQPDIVPLFILKGSYAILAQVTLLDCSNQYRSLYRYIIQSYTSNYCICLDQNCSNILKDQIYIYFFSRFSNIYAMWWNLNMTDAISCKCKYIVMLLWCLSLILGWTNWQTVTHH